MRVIVFPAAAAALSLLAGPALAQAAPSAQVLGLRLLTWPGKTSPQERLPRAEERPAPAPASFQASPAPRSLPASIYAPPPPATAPVTSAPVASAPVVSTPLVPAAQRQVQAAPRAQPQTQAEAASNDYTSPRFYSLHRAYGVQPDPIPLSPQFLATPTQDLAAPPPPPPQMMTMANGQVVRMINADPSPN